MRYITQISEINGYRLQIIDLHGSGGDYDFAGLQVIAQFKDAELAEEVKELLNARHNERATKVEHD